MTEADVPCVCAPDARSLPTAVYLRHQGRHRETQGETGAGGEGQRDETTSWRIGVKDAVHTNTARTVQTHTTSTRSAHPPIFTEPAVYDCDGNGSRVGF